MSQVQALEQQLKNAKELVAQRDLAIKLSENPDFRKLILDQFCTTECARYVQASADPALNAEQRADSLAIAQASGHLKRFLSVMVTMGNTAAREIGELEDQIEEARVEEDNE